MVRVQIQVSTLGSGDLALINRNSVTEDWSFLIPLAFSVSPFGGALAARHIASLASVDLHAIFCTAFAGMMFICLCVWLELDFLSDQQYSGKNTVSFCQIIYSIYTIPAWRVLIWGHPCTEGTFWREMIVLLANFMPPPHTHTPKQANFLSLCEVQTATKSTLRSQLRAFPECYLVQSMSFWRTQCFHTCLAVSLTWQTFLYCWNVKSGN